MKPSPFIGYIIYFRKLIALTNLRVSRQLKTESGFSPDSADNMFDFVSLLFPSVPELFDQGGHCGHFLHSADILAGKEKSRLQIAFDRLNQCIRDAKRHLCGIAFLDATRAVDRRNSAREA